MDKGSHGRRCVRSYGWRRWGRMSEGAHLYGVYCIVKGPIRRVLRVVRRLMAASHALIGVVCRNTSEKHKVFLIQFKGSAFLVYLSVRGTDLSCPADRLDSLI